MRKIVTATLILVTSNLYAENYLGVDYLHRWMHGRDANNYAMRLVLPEQYDSAEFYLSHRFDNSIGLSLGWEQSSKKTTTHTFSTNETFLGSPQNAGDSTNIVTKIKAINIDVNGYLDLDIAKHWEMIGQLGVSFMQSDMDGTLNTSGVSFNLSPSHSFYPLPRVGFGIQYFCTRHLGFRIIGHWIGSNLFKQKFTDEDGVRRNIKPFKQSWNFGVGLVARF